MNESSDSKFVTRKWNFNNDESKENYDVRNLIIYNAEVLKSNICYCNDACILERVDSR